MHKNCIGLILTRRFVLLHDYNQMRYRNMKFTRKSYLRAECCIWNTLYICIPSSKLLALWWTRVSTERIHPQAFRLPAVADRTDVARDSCLWYSSSFLSRIIGRHAYNDCWRRIGIARKIVCYSKRDFGRSFIWHFRLRWHISASAVRVANLKIYIYIRNIFIV